MHRDRIAMRIDLAAAESHDAVARGHVPAADQRVVSVFLRLGLALRPVRFVVTAIAVARPPHAYLGVRFVGSQPVLFVASELTVVMGESAHFDHVGQHGAHVCTVFTGL